MVGEALVQHPGVDKVTFTGSPKVGRGILRGYRQLQEGNSPSSAANPPMMISPTQILDRAARSAASGIFFNAGQVCSAGSRVLVQRPAYDEVVQRLAERARAIRVGDPSDPTTTMGPVISSGQMKTVLGYIEIGKSRERIGGDGGSASRRQRLLHRAHRVCWRRARNAYFPGGDFRPGASCSDSLRRRSGCPAHRQRRHCLQPCGGRLERRHRARASYGGRTQGRYGLDQHLRIHGM